MKQMECDTDTIIKVTIPKAEEGDDTKASVRIMSRSQDKSNIEKARKKIESFAKELAQLRNGLVRFQSGAAPFRGYLMVWWRCGGRLRRNH